MPRPANNLWYEAEIYDSPHFPKELLDKFSFRQTDCYELVFANGCFLPGYSSVPELDQGVVVTSLAQVLQDDNADIRACLESVKFADEMFGGYECAENSQPCHPARS